MLQMSDHSEVRAAQRSLRPEELEYVLHFGKRYYCEGARVYYLRRKDLHPADRRSGAIARLVGTAVVIAWDSQTVITVWRNRKGGLKFLRSRRERCGRNAPKLREKGEIWEEALDILKDAGESGPGDIIL